VTAQPQIRVQRLETCFVPSACQAMQGNSVWHEQEGNEEKGNEQKGNEKKRELEKKGMSKKE